MSIQSCYGQFAQLVMRAMRELRRLFGMSWWATVTERDLDGRKACSYAFYPTIEEAYEAADAIRETHRVHVNRGVIKVSVKRVYPNEGF